MDSSTNSSSEESATVDPDRAGSTTYVQAVVTLASPDTITFRVLNPDPVTGPSEAFNMGALRDRGRDGVLMECRGTQPATFTRKELSTMEVQSPSRRITRRVTALWIAAMLALACSGPRRSPRRRAHHPPEAAQVAARRQVDRAATAAPFRATSRSTGRERLAQLTRDHPALEPEREVRDHRQRPQREDRVRRGQRRRQVQGHAQTGTSMSGTWTSPEGGGSQRQQGLGLLTVSGHGGKPFERLPSSTTRSRYGPGDGLVSWSNCRQGRSSRRYPKTKSTTSPALSGERTPA